MQFTETRNLRGGRPCWTPPAPSILSDPLPDQAVDVAIVGAGVMGAMLAERLARQGRRVVLLDRRPPGHGSTAASTALVMWAADVPLTHLARRLGLAEAARRWRRVFVAVQRLAERIDELGIDCGRAARPELYLAGTLLNPSQLDAEARARREAGLPSTLFGAAEVAERFAIASRAALLSEGSYEVDPMRLTLSLLERAQSAGACVCFPVDVIAIEQRTGAMLLRLDDGRELGAKHAILASGYERSTWYLPPAFRVTSSYAIATPPATAPYWREGALIWEASSPYLYARETADGRIIAGGEDEDFDDAHRRDALIGRKAGTIRAKLAAMLGREDVPLDCAWAAAFGSSPDGLPAIGRAADRDALWLASGFGGNGVSFAALGAEIIAAQFDGVADPEGSLFDPYRFG